MLKGSLQNSFKEYCRQNNFEINKKQLNVLKSLENFLLKKKTLLNFFSREKKLCFYLHGNVGVGKTMIMDFIFNQIKMKKLKLHFNKFMINLHDFRHEKKDDNSLEKFVKNLKSKYQLIYLDEFQVTNIVDAMILGKLFEIIFLENLKVLITTNTDLKDLYKDGLQRDQFIPFINIIKKNSIKENLLLEDDYREHIPGKNKKIFYPLNEKTLFNMNKNFRILTKNLKKQQKNIYTKGRNFKINDYYEGIARFNFKQLCEKNLGAEDYLNISKVCKHIFIENIPKFNDFNSNQQLRFITLIDILYEQKVDLTLSMESELKKIGTSKKHSEIFKRTTSRLYELTASKIP
tara:strand:- start:245 stop:1285 length:1041 start_codon:yes stop_codon:yes gene_type:complete